MHKESICKNNYDSGNSSNFDSAIISGAVLARTIGSGFARRPEYP